MINIDEMKFAPGIVGRFDSADIAAIEPEEGSKPGHVLVRFKDGSWMCSCGYGKFFSDK